MNLRLLLWPILWWSFATSALYCAPTDATVQLAPPPPPVTLDLSRVSAADIERTVEHLQRLVHEAEQRADSLDANLEAVHEAHAAALTETLQLQRTIDTLTVEYAAALKREIAWKHRAQILMLLVSMTATALLSKFIMLLPIPWNWLGLAGAATTIYAALYFIL